MKIKELDFVFISYDEPNADSNFQHLASLVPQAQRVHGVRGYDRAHKVAAVLARTPNFIIVDGDCRIRAEFVESEYNFQPGVDLSNSVISWCSLNNINGLAYGNGGIKCWPRQHLLNIKSHELNDTVDFDCEGYLQMNSVAGDTYITGSPLQAWRAGYREGVKLALLTRVPNPDVDNERRLWQWCHIGLDVPHGMWAIAGARG